MVKLNAQDASFLMLESAGAPMHIGFLLTFKQPGNAPADYMQKLHAKLARFVGQVATGEVWSLLQSVKDKVPREAPA